MNDDGEKYVEETPLEEERSDFIHNMDVLCKKIDQLIDELTEIKDSARFNINEMCDIADTQRMWTKTLIDAIFSTRADIGLLIPDIYPSIDRVHEVIEQYHEIIHIAALMETRPEDYVLGDDWEALGRDFGLMIKYHNPDWVREVFLRRNPGDDDQAPLQSRGGPKEAA